MAGPGLAVLLGVVLAGCGAQSGDGANDNGRTVGIPASQGNSPDAARAPERNVVFVGTSLTAGLGLEPEEAYPSLIAERIEEAGLPYAVTNAGVSGETSAGLVARLDWLMEGDFDVIVVETGANDGLRGIPVETARRNIDAILTRIRASKPEAAIVLVQMESPPNLGRPYTDAFRAMYQELTSKHDAVLMPFLLEGVAGVAGMNQADGIHPNPAGAEKVAAGVWKVLEPVLRSRVAAGGDAR